MSGRLNKDEDGGRWVRVWIPRLGVVWVRLGGGEAGDG